MAKEDVRGFIVKEGYKKGRRFLSRSGYFVPQIDIGRAWVHEYKFLRKGGPWERKAGTIHSAIFRSEGTTEIIDLIGIKFNDFFKKKKR